MYATTTTGHREHVTVSKSTKVLQAMAINNNFCRLVQTTTQTTEEWLGLSYTDALSVCVASESSTLDGTTRNYLGSAKISVSGPTATQYAYVDGCWGTRISSQLSRMGETNCYQVTKNIEEMTVRNYGGSMELL